MGVEAAAKTFAICQLEKVLILLAKDEILKLYCLLSRYSNERKANQGHI